jgi:hypothetical protein
MCIIVVNRITSSNEASEGKPTVSSDRKAAVLRTIGRVHRTPPGSESGAYAYGVNPLLRNLGERPIASNRQAPCRRSEEGVLTINKSPGKGWENSSLPGEPNKMGHE